MGVETLFPGSATATIQSSVYLYSIPPGSYDASVRIWDCRARVHDPVQVMDEAKDSVTSLRLTNSEILTGSVKTSAS